MENIEIFLALKQSLKNFMDKGGRISQWPSKPKLKHLVLMYLIYKFKNDQKYSETEVNNILKEWHTFEDWALLRRELFEKGYLNRTLDCREYWRTNKPIILE